MNTPSDNRLTYQKTGFAQFGEDAVLAWLFHGRKNGFYVDVGCHHPFRFSNTALLHTDHGWTGINIDVDERATALFELYRPNDINMTIGIAGQAGRRTVTIFEEGAINSFDDEAASHPAWANIPREKREVDVQPLGAILHKVMPKDRAITLLNIDAEGLDVEILMSNDWSAFRPEVITVEVHNFDLGNVQQNPTYKFLQEKGYRLISHVALTSIYQLTDVRFTGITDEEVIWLYRCMLGRDPESPETIAWFKRENPSFDQGREYLKKSLEFIIKNPAAQQYQYYIPERFPLKFVKSTKRLALAAIVKNETSYIENMLRSCAPLIDYAVVIDTGSTDDTVNIVRSTLTDLDLANTVNFVPFEDFSQARNAALERVPSDMDWILMLDADEEIVPEDYGRFAALLEAEDAIDGWLLPRMTFKDAGRRKPLDIYPDFQTRLFRNRAKNPVRFSGEVHEAPRNVARWGYAPINQCETGEVGGPHIHHLGYIDITPERWQQKHDLYAALKQKISD